MAGVNAGTRGTKELKGDYDELTVSDSTKAVGHVQTLEPETSLVPKRLKVGI